MKLVKRLVGLSLRIKVVCTGTSNSPRNTNNAPFNQPPATWPQFVHFARQDGVLRRARLWSRTTPGFESNVDSFVNVTNIREVSFNRVLDLLRNDLKTRCSSPLVTKKGDPLVYLTSNCINDGVGIKKVATSAANSDSHCCTCDKDGHTTNSMACPKVMQARKLADLLVCEIAWGFWNSYDQLGGTKTAAAGRSSWSLRPF